MLLPSIRASRLPLLKPLAASLATMLVAPVCAQSADETGEPILLRSSPVLQPPLRGDDAKRLPIILKADRLGGTPDLDATAMGHAEFRRGGISISADSLRYERPDDLATASGHVRISRDGNLYTGPELRLKVERFQGYFLSPTYHFARTGAGGTADRIDFIDQDRSVAINATYTSCPADGSGAPDWLLSADKVSIDVATNTGVADGGVLRFYGVPILGAPHLSFPLTDERKSGWLPPTIVPVDSRAGPSVAIPYYWNIAPNRDLTITPQASTRRGPSVDTDVRYLEPDYGGRADINLVPYDAVYGAKRYSLFAQHDGNFADGTQLHMNLLRVSDDDYWKDFPANFGSATPRLLGSQLSVNRPFGDWQTYARVENWQVLQTADPTTRIEAPYEREPQIGARYRSTFGRGLELAFETEFNRFINPTNASLTPRPTGNRVHALGSAAWPYVTPGWVITPKVSFNAASYTVDQPLGSVLPGASGSRIIPTVSLDSAWVFERNTEFFGKAVRQTLEPRLLYVNTPFRDQSNLPNFDAYPKDFNFDSIFTDNAFTGVDRVSDAHQVTAGVITRFIDPDTGGEKARLGVAQRYLLRDQLVTPDSVPLTRRFSDIALLGATTVLPTWSLDGSVQYSPDTNRVSRAVVSARYAPGPYRTLSATYRSTAGLSQQIELGWQWPLYGRTPAEGSRGGGADCKGTWYGVGRTNYSTRDRRLVDAIVGVEYDAGCWIGRIVATRQSTGLSESTTRLMFQLELIGLSRLGSNPLQLLKDNIPGYKLLREDRTAPSQLSTYD